MKPLKDRLIEFIDFKGMSKRAFLLSCGFSESYLNNISKGISYESIDKIKSKYPELSMPWLVLGEGEMLVKEKNATEVNQIDIKKYVDVLEENRILQNENRELRIKIEMLTTEIENLKNGKDFTTPNL